jgi:hypothetical protein
MGSRMECGLGIAPFSLLLFLLVFLVRGFRCVRLSLVDLFS